jgi:calcineurin-like phosphoesterase family protein
MIEQKLWFYSDPHFFHHNIIRFSNRPYQNVEEMNQDLIHKFNSKVGKEDIQKCLDIYHTLNGSHKTLILGNHDKSTHYFPFDVTVKSLKMTIADEEVLVNHYPYRPIDCPEMKKKPLDEGKYLIHGHSHNQVKVKDKMINVCCDSWDYLPVSIEEICEIINSIKND